MADSFNKKEREKKRRKRKQDKAEKKLHNKLEGEKPLEFMYVDEDGNLSPTPPDPAKKKKIKLEDIAVSTPKGNESDDSKYERNGTVKFYNGEKGYGFISEANSNEDYFVHVDNLMDPIKEHDKVVFEIGAGPKGLMAVKVRLFKEKKVEPVVEEPVAEDKPATEGTPPTEDAPPATPEAPAE